MQESTMLGELLDDIDFAVPTNGITTEIIWTLGLFCALCTLVYFGAQQLIVALRKPNLDRVW
jgi:hypothetical protein